MSKTPFMPLWVSDFVTKTMDLDARETGAYLLLIMALWSHGGELPDDPKKLQRIARCGREWPRVWAAIKRFFVVENGVVTQPRVTLELQKVNTKREVNVQNGARGGRAKSLKNKDQGLANATNSPGVRSSSHTQNHSYSEANASAAEAALPTFEADTIDARKEAIWKRGVPFLVERGVTERQARSVIGKWLRDHGSEALFSALADAAQAQTHDPIPYIEAALSPRPDIRDVMQMAIQGMKQ